MQTSFLSQVSQEHNVSKELHVATEPDIPSVFKQAYQLWKGKQSFFFGGRVILGPRDTRWGAYAYFTALFVLTIIFYEVILKALDTNHRLRLGVGFGVGMATLVVFSVLTAITEPGVIPNASFLGTKGLLDLTTPGNQMVYNIATGQLPTPLAPAKVDANPVELKEGQTQPVPAQSPVDAISNKPQASSLHPTPDAANEDKPSSRNGILDTITIMDPVKSKRFCAVCRIHKPPRTYHCSKCSSCVRGFSHHCFLVNNCIGKRNYRYFILMVLAGFLVDGYFVTCLILYHEKAKEASRILYKVAFFITIFQGILVLGFCAFYLLGFLMTGGNRHDQTGVRESAAFADVDERNDMCGGSPSLVHWEKVMTSDEERGIQGEA